MYNTPSAKCQMKKMSDDITITQVEALVSGEGGRPPVRLRIGARATTRRGASDVDAVLVLRDGTMAPRLRAASSSWEKEDDACARLGVRTGGKGPWD